MTNERTASKNMVSITWNTDSSQLIQIRTEHNAEMKQLQSLHLMHVTKVLRQNLCFLQGSQARFPAHVYFILDTSSWVYMRCSWFLLPLMNIIRFTKRVLVLSGYSIRTEESCEWHRSKFFKSYFLWKPSRRSLVQQAFQTLHDRYNPTKRIQGATWNEGNTHVS